MLPLKVSPIITDALQNNKPIIVIESTIFAHGLPSPINFDCALKIEKTILEAGVVPAISILNNGYINIGYDKELIEKITNSKNVEKVSTRDIASTLYNKKIGATTVAGTIVCAKAAGIDIMVTGGIGGVHRNIIKSNDISADLTELGRNNITVVCSGVKSILDIGKTLEYLETIGVPTIGYKTKSFPSFYSTHSGYSNSYKADTFKEIASLINYHKSLERGIIISNPPPKNFAIDPEKVNNWIDVAEKEAEKLNIIGKEITPFILKRLREISKNKTLETNIKLIIENAKVASSIALSLKKNIK